MTDAPPPQQPETEDDGCAFMGTFMGVAQRCDEPPYSDWHDPSSLAFKHEYEHDCGEAMEPPLPVDPDLSRILREATPGPWVVQQPGDNDPGAGTVFIDTHAYEDGPEPVVAASYPLKLADAVLIVHAVNAFRGASVPLPVDPEPAPLHGHNYGGDWIECTDEHPSVTLPVDPQTEPLICAACGGTQEPVVIVPLHPACDWDAARAASPAPAPLDVERLGFYDLLDVANAILTNYPPDTIVCSHSVKADRGALTTAAIADLIASARLQSEPITEEPKP